jgi:trk system potassium uptake protein TrkA
MDGNFEALEFIVKEDIPSLTDIPLKELKPRRGVLVACIVHNGNVIIPTGDDMIRRGDTVIIITSDKQMNSIRDIL